MRIFISGASGLVGSNCMQHFLSKSWDVKGSHLTFPLDDTVYFDTLNDDVKNFDIKSFNPDVIIHCGALTHVDYCETNEIESYQKTVQSTINLMEIAINCNSKFILISTDYVFDGEIGPYTEDCIPNPLNIYGKHKLAAEQAIKNLMKDYLIIRVTNVYGDEKRGKNFVSRILNQINENATINITLPCDQYATPTNALDIARALYYLIKDDKRGVYHIASTDFMNRVSLAYLVFHHKQYYNFNIEQKSTESLSQAALRPLKGGLIASRFHQEYPSFIFSTLESYLQTKK